jgi:tetratricopeptide (TPR) repeat protein
MADSDRRCFNSLPLSTALLLLVLCLAGCKPSERTLYQDGMMKMQAQQYQEAADKFDASLKLNPDSKSALYRKAYCLYKLDKFSEAQPLFEQFLKETDNNEWTATFLDERRDAEFFRDKCKQAQGQAVPQNPDAIPPPPMGE